MAHFSIDSFKSYAVAAVATAYCSLMFLAAVGPNAAHFGGLVAREKSIEGSRLRSQGHDDLASTFASFIRLLRELATRRRSIWFAASPPDESTEEDDDHDEDAGQS